MNKEYTIEGIDASYFSLVNFILSEGHIKKNRTGVDTIGVFGAQAKYEIDLNAFPILTTKKVFFKAIVHELLWFINGNTNIKYLVDNDVHIWDEWAYKKYITACRKERDVLIDRGAEVDYQESTQEQFIQKIKEDAEFASEWGELGMGTYGGMWRDFPYWDTDELIEDGEIVNTEYKFGGVDQLQKVIDKLKTNPDDRRMIVSAWHPYWVDHCALPPCHCMFHFNTEELTWKERIEIGEEKYPKTNFLKCSDGDLDTYGIPRRRLNCLLYQRSCDTFLGVPFNITSYCLLTAMIAHVVGMTPGTFTHTYGDLHIYTNHIEQLKLQKTREPRKLPKLILNSQVNNLTDFKYDDIKLEGYDPHPAIKGEVAV